MKKEASARIKNNDLLKESGWRYFVEKGEKANIILENQTKITQKMIDEYGYDFEFSSKGFIDFQQLDEHSHPIIVLEAKSEKHNPLVGKEQSRAYAKTQNCRFFLLSNCNLYYVWDTQQENPYIITKFPSPKSMKGYEHNNPAPDALGNEIVTTGYIAITQKHDYDQNPDFHSEDTKQVIPQFVFYYTQSSAYKDWVVTQAKTRTISNINVKQFSSLEVSVPPVPIQQSIMQRIETEQKLVEANRELINSMSRKLETR